jgi:phage terminase large subunit
MKWPPDFDAEFKRRALVQQIIRSTPNPADTAVKHYGNNCLRFVQDCCITYDPRNPAKNLPARMPLIPFPKQAELIEFVQDLMSDQECGLVEKSRDMGATWICAAISVWLWLYVPGSSVGWGSRKEQLVDKLGDPDSIFEKIRMIIRNLPDYTLPAGFSEKEHLHFMKCVNPANDATITGEAGDNIGRGGRKSIYFKDESAHYERPELIEAALGDNTNVQVDISSVCGEGTVFHRKRLSGAVRPFIMDWRDHPAKDQAWYDKRKQAANDQGLAHIFAQEVDRDYSAAVEGIFIPSEWVKAAIDAHIKLGIEPAGEKRSGLDVADEGADKNAQIDMHGQLITYIEQWAEGDTVETAKTAWNHCIESGIEKLIFDSIGVGAGVKGKARELAKMPENQNKRLDVIGFASGSGVIYPNNLYVEGKTNKDMFANAKAQVWWFVRELFHDTYKAVIQGKDISIDRIISIPSELKWCNELISELSRPKREADASGKIIVESKKKMRARGIRSPNLADAFVMVVASSLISANFEWTSAAHFG